ncbi:MAG: hypothetical protein GY780_03095 [bacterium]|nr:hypothetical protein [bacterium]
MKKKLLNSTLCLLLISSSAWAINDDGVNSLGVYFDNGVFEESSHSLPASVPAYMYFVLANCSEPTIMGYEFRWSFDPDPTGLYFILNNVLPPNSINNGDWNNLMVEIGSPLVPGEAMILLQVQVMALIPGISTQIMAGPSIPSSGPGWPTFANENGQTFPMTYSTFSPGEGSDIDPLTEMISVGQVGQGPGPVATEFQTFNSLKALYR